MSPAMRCRSLLHCSKTGIPTFFHVRFMHRHPKAPTVIRSSSTEPILHGPITSYIQDRIDRGAIRHDPEQLDLAYRLDRLRQDLIQSDASVIPASKLSVDLFVDAKPKGIWNQAQRIAQQTFFQLQYYSAQRNTPKGVYIHGSVGVGKSFLMDLFVDTIQQSSTENNTNDTNHSPLRNRPVRRIHFHEFMLDVHDRIHRFKQQYPREDPIPSVALSIAQEARLLCLDEFQVTDIADAAILKRLLSMLWRNHNHKSSIGMVLVATSNRAPDSLYEGGLNRTMFVPFIRTLKDNMDVVEMSGRRDYRREKPDVAMDTDESYFWPADSASTRQSLGQIFVQAGGTEQNNTKLPVRMGRYVRVPRSNDNCAWFDFDDLCDRPLGAADYLSICERYKVLIVDNVPQLDVSRFNEARRFVTLIDAIYESKTRLILASQQVPLHDLFVGFDATVESNDGDEEIAVADIPEKVHDEREQMFVKGEGGSSSSAATTMIRSKEGEIVEWSATGRIGVSLAQLSAVRDVSFSFQRAESRLVEMNNGTWGR